MMNTQTKKQRLIEFRENVQPVRQVIDGPGWFYCKKVGHKIPVCRMTTCKNYPCKPKVKT